MRRNILFLLAAAAVLLLGQSALAQTKTFKGKLDKNKQFHEIKLQKGKSYQIDMMAQFDTFLRLPRRYGQAISV